MEIIRLTQPETAAEPITLAHAKVHLRKDQSDEDSLIQALISSAREYAEHHCNRILARATFAVLFDEFDDVLRLPAGTVSVTSITYLDTDDVQQTLAAEEYTVDLERRTITPVEYWPSGTNVRVAITAGHDPQQSSELQVPPSIVAAIKMIVADLFGNREMSVAGAYVPTKTVTNLLNMNRVHPGT